MEKQRLDKGTVEMELKAARVTIGRDDRVIQDVSERACVGYATLIHA